MDISPEKVAARIKGVRSRVKIEELAETLIQKFGGVDKFADRYVKDYEAAKMGSNTRARLLDGAMKLMQFVGKKDEGVSVEQMSDEEMNLELKDHLEDLVKATNIKDLVVDPPAAEAADNGTPPNQ